MDVIERMQAFIDAKQSASTSDISCWLEELASLKDRVAELVEATDTGCPNPSSAAQREALKRRRLALEALK